MSLISYKRSQGSIILRVKVLNSSVTTGAGLTGLAFGSAGLIVGTIADNEATSTAYTQAGGLIETIAALGTYAAPTATKCRFKEVDATNHPGVYEIQLADARYAVSNAKSLLVSVLGATNCAETDAVIPLTDVDPYTNKLGTPVALDGGSATIAGMLTKMADDSGGAAFDAGTDSLEKIQTSVAAGFPQNVNADVEPAGGIITTGTNTANDSDSTWANDGTYWQVAAATAAGGFGLNMHQVFTLGLTLKPSILRVNAKETLSGVVHVWLYDYDAAAWEQVSDNDTAISGNADNDFTYIINGRHQQASDGEVQVRYTSTSEETNKYLYLDLVVIQAVAISELTAAEIAQAVWEADLAVVHGAFQESAGHILHDTFAVVTTVATGDTATSFTLTAGQAANDCYNGQVIIIEDETDSHYETRRIVDYTSGRVVTVDRAFSFTPAAGDHVEIVNISYADVNVTHLAASAIQQASGYIKVSSGTGTGQLSLASGIIASNMNQILGTTLTETSGGYLTAAFKKLFDVASPVLTAAGVDQTGDSYSRIGAAGVGLTDVSLVSTGLASVTAWTVDITGTVSGNSTHSAANVYTAFGDGSNLTTCATATGFSTHSAADVVTALGTGSTLTDCATATGFSTHSAADVVTALGTGSTLTDCATATGFNTVVPPSVAQFNARTLVAADYFDFTSDEVITNAASRTASKATGFSTPANVTDAHTATDAGIAAVKADTASLLTRITATLFSGITSLASWLGLIAGKTADAPTLAEIQATTAGAGYTNLTDSLQAIRDSGGGTVTDITAAALAKFCTEDTGETVGAPGSVAKISQGAAGGNVTVGDFTVAALAQLATEDTLETAIVSGSALDLVWAKVIETGIDARQALALIGASTAGKLTGADGTTVTICGMGVDTTRIVATVDEAWGNRTAVTLTPPS